MEKDHLEILLEDIRGKFDLVLEGHDTLCKEIRDTSEELCEKISLVDFKFGRRPLFLIATANAISYC